MSKFLRPGKQLLGVLTLLVLTILGVVSPSADAHARLESSVPAAGQALQTAPLRIELIFDEPVSMSATGIKVFDTKQERVDQKTPRVNGSRAQIGLLALPVGAYVVVWKAVSDDGHPIAGSFTFQVGAGDQAALAALGDKELRLASASPVFRAVTRVVRFGLFASVAALIGGAVWSMAGLMLTHRRWAKYVGAIGAFSSVILLLIDGPYVESRPLSAVSDLGLLVESLSRTTGRAFAALMPVCLVFGRSLTDCLSGNGTSFSLAVEAPSQSLKSTDALRARVWRIGCVAVASLLLSATGHGAAGRLVPVAVAATAIHIAAISTWVSGLFFLIIRAKTMGRNSFDAEFSAAWSRLATGSVVLIVGTGIFAGWRQVGSRVALTDTAYGRILMIKLLIVAAMLMLGALHRRQHATQQSNNKPTWNVSTLRGEAVLGVCALALTMALSAAIPARSAYARPLSLRIQTTSARSDLTIEPARVGRNIVHLYVFGKNGIPVAITDAQFTFTHSGTGTIVEVNPTNVGTGHREARSVALPLSGNWVVETRIYLSDFDVETGNVSFTVK